MSRVIVTVKPWKPILPPWERVPQREEQQKGTHFILGNLRGIVPRGEPQETKAWARQRRQGSVGKAAWARQRGSARVGHVRSGTRTRIALASAMKCWKLQSDTTVLWRLGVTETGLGTATF